MNNKTKIAGITLIMSASVHQSTGHIYFRKIDDGSFTSQSFSVEEALAIQKELNRMAWSTSLSSATYFPGYGERISCISVFMGQEMINDAFGTYFETRRKKSIPRHKFVPAP